jgi:taurine dioxygenase
MNMSVTVTPLTQNIGAEISGIDLSQELDDKTRAVILQAWLDHGIIVFHDQVLSEHDQVEVSKIFGDLHQRPRPADMRNESKREDADPYDGYTMLVSNIRENGKPIGSLPDGEMEFHADMSYVETPARATVLYGVEVPKKGGDTLFASTTAAYDALDDDTKALLSGRKALQGFLHGTTLRENNTTHLSHAHPAVMVIPETGGKSLYISQLMTFAIEGLDKAESAALLERLFKHIEQPQFRYSHQWQPNDLIIWDNRTTVHARTDFDPNERRLLRRFVTIGEQPIPA